MRIKSIRIKNYHSIVDCSFEFPNLLALIGENNTGKSNIIYALNLFFSKDKPRDRYSFNNPSEPIEIIIEFGELTEYERNKITEDHRDDDIFILKKIYKYDASTGDIEKDFTSVKNGEDTNKKPRGFEHVLTDTLPEFYLLRAVKYCSEEIKMTKTTNFNKFLNLIFKEFKNDFEEWDKIIQELEKEIQKTNEEAPLVKISKEISATLKEQFSDADVKLKPKAISRLDILNTLDVFLDDDCDLPLLNKGQGTQRAFIFAILRILAKKINEERPGKEKEKKDIVIAIEEPELFLHPHQQKIVYLLLKELSQQTKEQIQIIYSTHSSFMIHVEDYKFIGLVRKADVSSGTKIIQHTGEIFTGDPKKEFQLLCQFDPERNELFFAKKVIFVEGNTEKFSLPVILNKIGIDSTAKSISIVECGSKGGIKLFIEMVNKFNQNNKAIDCLVMYDKDIPWYNEEDPDKIIKEKQAEKDNKYLEKICGTNPVYVSDPDFERNLNFSFSPKTKNKPYKARKEIINDMIKLPKGLEDFFKKNL